MIVALLGSTLKVSLVLLLALAASALARRQSAAWRHGVLAAAIVCAAALPAIAVVLPSWTVRLPAVDVSRALDAGGLTSAPAAPRADTDPSRTPGPTGSRVDPDRLAAMLWLTGFGLGLATLLAGMGRLAWLASRSEPVVEGPWADQMDALRRDLGVRRPVRLLQSRHPTLLVTWGLLTPRVLLPATAREWPEARIRVVLCHELAHIRRHDWAMYMVAELLRCVYWFNPLVWMARSRLRNFSEHACDDEVLTTGVKGADFAAHLLDVTRAFTASRSWLPAPAIARPSGLERRVTAMLNTRVSRRPLTRSIRLLIGVSAIAVTLPIAALAQGAFASFSGSVFDPMQSFLPGATLMLTNEQSHAKYEVQSDRTGQFEFVGLPAGSYLLEARLPGFATLRGTLSLTGQDVARDLTLRLGSLEETVTVVKQALGPVLETAPTPPGDANLLPLECNSPPARGDRPMGGNIKVPRKIAHARPLYPAGNVAGQVLLEGCIGVNGFFRELRLVQAAHPDLAAAAADAVNRWQFSETLLNGVPVEVPMRVHVQFTLRP